MESLKYLSNFRRTLEMPLINCEINIILTWSEICIIVTGNYANNTDNKPRFKKIIENFMFQLGLYQLKIMKNYCSN